MQSSTSLADLAAGWFLKLIAMANLLLLASFLAMSALAIGQAKAETIACTGKNLLAELERDDPAVLAQIRAEGLATPNGQGVLWKVEKAGASPSFLFGTLHLTDPRVAALTPSAQAAFDGADTVVIETTDVLDQSKVMAALAREPELMMFTDATTLTSLMSPADAADVSVALDQRGISLASVSKMKPWMLSSMIALPQCETARQAAGAKLLDLKLANDAEAAGKTIGGLETIGDQLRAMASLPMDFHIRGLIDTLKLGSRMDDVIETMIVIYEVENTGIFWPLFKAALPGAAAEEGYAEFDQTMIVARNRKMAAAAEPFLTQGQAFIAVGALHLPGAEGLVELFRQRGYAVTAVP